VRASVHQIETPVHGHYLVAAPGGPGPHPLLVGFHGYGETAADHLAALSAVPGTDRWLLCAVQGLNAFYRVKTGEVVAGWMTRFNRELAIADNLRYVGAVVSEVKRQGPASDLLVYAGFSQGVAMAYRAAAGAGHRAAGLVVLAGDVPPDVAAQDLAAFPRALLGRGASDASYPAQQLERDLATLRDKGVTAEPITFAGGHRWAGPWLRRVGEFLAELARESGNQY
jgi:predicted esterase